MDKPLLGKKKRTSSQIGKASRSKGKVFERKIANMLTARGFTSRRSVQFDGMFDYDITNDLPINFECKAVENLNLQKSMEQSITDAKRNDDIPVVVHKKNSKKVMCTMLFEDFIDLIQYATGYVDEQNTIPFKEVREKYIDKCMKEIRAMELL